MIEHFFSDDRKTTLTFLVSMTLSLAIQNSPENYFQALARYLALTCMHSILSQYAKMDLNKKSLRKGKTAQPFAPAVLDKF